MKKNLHFYIMLFLIPFAAFLFMSQSDGAIAGVTGSPKDVNSCSNCHQLSTTNFNASLEITTDIPSGGYALGDTYNITITQTSTGASKYGFEITAETTSSKAGVFTPIDGSTQNPSSDTDFATHTSSGTAQKIWIVSWTAPSTDVGAITFYAASDAANGNGTEFGDQIVFNNKVIGSVLAINDALLLHFNLFPNPSNGRVTLQLPSGTNKANVKIFDYLGKTLIQKNLNNTNNNLDVSNLSAGIYFVRIQSDTKVGTKKLVVR